MIFKTLFSGSSGNCHYLNINNNHILVDCGGAISKLTRELLKLDVELKQISYIIITHYHGDHCSNIKYFKKAKVFHGKEVENIKDFNIDYFPLFHDKENFGYIIENDIAIITDTGTITDEILNIVKDCKLIAVESNYNYDMLIQNSISFHIKQRIISNKGHLNNEQCFNFLEKCNNDIIIILHISEQRNNIDIIKKLYGNDTRKIYYSKSDLLNLSKN